MQSVHEGVIFKCDQCTECIVKTKKGLKKHVLSKHPGPEQKANPLLCTEDGCTFISFIDREKSEIVAMKDLIVSQGTEIDGMKDLIVNQSMEIDGMKATITNLTDQLGDQGNQW